MNVNARLNELSAMKDGWREGAGPAPNPTGLNWLAAALETNFFGATPAPYIHPTPDSNVRLEWSLKGQEISLDINLATRHALWHRLEPESGSKEEKMLNLVSAAGWEWLNAEIDRWANLR